MKELILFLMLYELLKHCGDDLDTLMRKIESVQKEFYKKEILLLEL